SDVDSGDGAGILTQLPDSFIRGVFDAVPPPGHYGIAQWMVPRTSDLVTLRGEIDLDLASVGLTSRAWREVPVDSSLLGPTSRAGEPLFFQQLIVRENEASTFDLERALFSARKVIEHRLDVYA